jgi:hypothetical protein
LLLAQVEMAFQAAVVVFAQQVREQLQAAQAVMV